MTRTLVRELAGKTGQTVTVSGWVNTRRDHGGLIFIDLRDHTGLIQLVIHPDQAEAFKLAEEARSEFVLSVTGTVKERDEGLKNPNLLSGNIEIATSEIRVLNRSDVPPIPVSDDAPQAGEELRL